MISAPPNFLTANAALRKYPIVLIEIAGYARKFTNRPTGVTGQVDWITSIEDHSITVNDLDGGADLGEFVFNVQDYKNQITADFPSFIFEGKTITCKTGFIGMSQSDYALLFTGKIDSVASDNGNTEYKFTCVDNKDVLSKVIYTTGDDGHPTDQDHRRTLNGHPLNILAVLLVNELGLTNSDFNLGKLNLYANGLFAGVQFVFSIDSPPAAKDFIEQQLLKPLGGYIWVNSKGQLDFNFFRRDSRILVTGGCLLATFTDSSNVIIGAPFSVGIPLGVTLQVKAPPGATKLSFGINDDHYVDNVGAWSLTVNGTPVSVSALNRPWDIVANPAYSFNSTSSTASTTTPVTAGTIYSIVYTGGTCSLGPGWPFTDPTGNPGVSGSASDGAGQYAVSVPLSITDPNMTLNHDNMTAVPEATQADLINTLSFRFDKSTDGKFQAESVSEYTVSTSRYGQFGQQIIEADGMRSGFQGFFLAAFSAQMIFLRYGLKNLTFPEVSALWTAVLLEPGDLVAVTSPQIPDRQAGVMGVTGKLFEVLDRTWNFTDCVVTVRLLDASYLLALGQYRISPDGTANFVPAGAYEKGRYMFLCNNSDQYSDTTAGHPLG